MGAPTASLRSRFLEIGQHGSVLAFSFRRCFETSLGLSLRRREAHRAAKSALRPLGPVRWLPADLVLVVDGEAARPSDVARVLNEIDRCLERIAERPLSARVVERTLGITGRERSRWTKNGRLARAGAGLIRRGHVVGLDTYAVRDIARLTNEPATIRAWREADDRGAGGGPAGKP